MILTIKRTEALRKLKAAKERGLKAIRLRNAGIEQRYKKARAERIKALQAVLTKLRSGKHNGDLPYALTHAIKREDPLVEECTEYDAAIAMLEMSDDETIAIKTERDKDEVAAAIIEACRPESRKARRVAR